MSREQCKQEAMDRVIENLPAAANELIKLLDHECADIRLRAATEIISAGLDLHALGDALALPFELLADTRPGADKMI